MTEEGYKEREKKLEKMKEIISFRIVDCVLKILLLLLSILNTASAPPPPTFRQSEDAALIPSPIIKFPGDVSPKTDKELAFVS